MTALYDSFRLDRRVYRLFACPMGSRMGLLGALGPRKGVDHTNLLVAGMLDERFVAARARAEWRHWASLERVDANAVRCGEARCTLYRSREAVAEWDARKDGRLDGIEIGAFEDFCVEVRVERTDPIFGLWVFLEPCSA